MYVCGTYTQYSLLSVIIRSTNIFVKNLKRFKYYKIVFPDNFYVYKFTTIL